MKKILVSISLCSFICMYSQMGNVGINTILPGSTFTINGSLAANYKSLASSTVLGIGDFYTAYNGSSVATFTLPTAVAASPGVGNILGRVYYIKNTGTANLTIKAGGSELIDNWTGAGITDFVVAPGGYTMIISKGTVTGTTWEVALLLNKSVNTVGALSAADNVTITGQNFTDFNNSIPQVIPFSISNQIINQGRAVIWNDSEDCWEVLESGVYRLDGFSYFGSGGPVSGTGAFTGINLVILKNGKTLSNIIGGTRLNLDNAIASAGNSPVSVSTVSNLAKGDKIYLAINWAAVNKPTVDAHIFVPFSLKENRSFSIVQLSNL